MQNKIGKYIIRQARKAKKEVKNYPIIYSLLVAILLGAFFVRVYRIDQLLGFYFDQGRDGVVIWKLWHEGKFFLIGPTTGIAGIFRGPWYYWLIAPAYLLGGGNPVWPSVFLSLTTVFAIFLLYLTGREIGGRWVGIIAATIAAFSFNLVLASRWLSNPTPMLLIGVGLVYSLLRITKGGKKYWWVVVAFLSAMAMQFGSAAEVFYIPAIAVFAVWQRKRLPDIKTFIAAVGVFLAVFVPQIIFDFRHNGVLSSAIKIFLSEEGSFKLSFWEVVKVRLPFYFDVFTTKIWSGERNVLKLFLALGLGLIVVNIKKLWHSDGFRIVLLLLVSPMIGMLFFQGNEGNVYDYYFTGYYLVFILLTALALGLLTKIRGGWLVLLLFFFFFFKINGRVLNIYLPAGVDGPTHITLGNQLQTVDWIFDDAKEVKFNVDVYVPPVIPHAYDYLFLWRGTQRCGDDLCGLKLDTQEVLLYTLYEVDSPHPERLEAWLERQAGIGRVEEEVSFGGVTVQRRIRI